MLSARLIVYACECGL